MLDPIGFVPMPASRMECKCRVVSVIVAMVDRWSVVRRSVIMDAVVPIYLER